MSLTPHLIRIPGFLVVTILKCPTIRTTVLPLSRSPHTLHTGYSATPIAEVDRTAACTYIAPLPCVSAAPDSVLLVVSSPYHTCQVGLPGSTVVPAIAIATAKPQSWHWAGIQIQP